MNWLAKNLVSVVAVGIALVFVVGLLVKLIASFATEAP